MDIGLFDLYTSGHHLSHAVRIKQSLETLSDHEVTFVTLSETNRCSERFDPDEVAYVDAPDSPPLEDRDGSFGDVADTAVEAFCSGDLIGQYDIVHFLYADDILGPLWRHAPRVDNTRLVGEVNGVFFHRGTILRRRYLHGPFLRVLGSPLGGLVDVIVPERTAHEALWQDLYLYRCLNAGTFDSVVVHSREADDYLSQLDRRRLTRIAELPYPAPAEYGTDVSKGEARNRLDLPADDRILLYFGGMRTERGIDILLDALHQYRGPTFTMVLAGPPTAVSEGELETVGRESSATVVSDLGFIDTPELYYRAADAVVLPYKRKYGKERASQMFEEVCGAGRPVIVPDFGVLGRYTREWELGTTYEQSSVRSLVATLERFATEGIPFSEERMREYSDQHSYDRVVAELTRLYSGDESHGSMNGTRLTETSGTR